MKARLFLRFEQCKLNSLGHAHQATASTSRRHASAKLLLAFLFGCSLSSAGAATEIDRGGYVLRLNSDSPNTSTALGFNVEIVGQCLLVSTNKVSVDALAREVRLSVRTFTTGFLCPFPPEDFIPIGRLPSPGFLEPDVGGGWQFTVYEESADSEALFNDQNIIGEFSLEVPPSPSGRFFHETPADGSTQSGLSMIRGWACDAELIEIQFNEDDRISLSYGSRRTDTEEVCGDTDNGYGMVMAWGLLGLGQHVARVYVNGRLSEEIPFTVEGYDDPFLTGREGSFELPNFPDPGINTLIRWDQPGQDFRVIRAQ